MYCTKCGNEISPATSFCSTCGQAVPGLPAMTPVANAIATVPPAPVLLAAGSYAGVAYAGFWLRFVAYVIDGIISIVAFMILLIPLFVLTGAGAALGRIFSDGDISDDMGAFLGVGFIFGFFGIILVVSWLYNALSESSSWQATPGKKILNLKVTDMEGQPISFGRASGRYFAKIITGMIPLFIGYIMAGFTEKKQALHDMIAGCLVLRSL
ncbi:MAG: RDD family protein [Candidatus Acidiferrum sp.]